VIALRERTRLAALLAAGLAITACSRKPAGSTPATAAPTPAVLDSTLAAGAGAAGGGGGGDSTMEPMPLIVPADRSADSTASAPLALTLHELGYRSGVTLSGTADEMTLTIPVNDGLHPTELRLAVLPTPGMPLATVTLRQRDRVLAMREVTDSTSSLVLPLTGALVQDGRAIVTLGLNVPGRDACQAQLFYHVVFTPDSRVVLTGTPSFSGAVNGFFPPWLSKVTFYLGDTPSLDAAQAALDAAAFVARHYRGMSTVFEVKPLPAAGTPLPEPGPYERAMAWSPTGITSVVRPAGTRGTVLAIAARRDARQIFTLADGEGLVAAPGLRAGTVELSHNLFAQGATTRTLADLGFTSQTLQGNSLLTASYPVAMADFGTGASPSALRLIITHSVLPPDGNGSLRVHLNGSLIFSRALDRTDVDVVVPIPAHLLRRDNVFEVRFQVVLGEGGCVAGGPLFTATIDDASAFVTDQSTPLPPGFGRFPSSFVPAFSVLLEPRDRFRVELATQLIGAMQQTTHTPLAPALARDRAAATGPLLAIGTTPLAEALNAPLQSEGVRLRDRSGTVWDEFSPDTSYGAMQAWHADGNDILLLHHTGTDGAPLAALVRETLEPYGWFGVRGDLAIRGPSGPTRTLTVANAGWRLEATPGGEPTFLSRYRSAIFIAATLILLALLIWLYPRVVRRELDTAG
jgi:hypothetical protein